jgi:cephalosporin hydroxylase
MEIEQYKKMVKEITTCPLGIGIAQNWIQLGSIFDDLVRFDIKLLVELGVFLGGMSELMLLRTERVPHFDYFGTQLDYEQVNQRVAGNPKVIQGDNFSPAVWGRVGSLVANTVGTAMIYCDGGDKQREMDIYTPLLRVGDYLRAHDCPGETTPEFLVEYADTHPNMVEIEQQKCRELGYTLWKRIA